MKLGSKFGAVVGLHDEDTKRQTLEDIVDEADGRGLVAGAEDLEDADAGAVVDGCERVEALSRTCSGFWTAFARSNVANMVGSRTCHRYTRT